MSVVILPETESAELILAVLAGHVVATRVFLNVDVAFRTFLYVIRFESSPELLITFLAFAFVKS